MPRPSQQAKILEAALHCFASLGYDATRIKHIAEAAAVSEGAIYRHYESKEALAQALFWDCMGRVSLALAETAGRTDLGIEERLRAIVAVLLSFYRAEPDAAVFVLIRPPTFKLTAPQGFVFPVEIIERLIEQGQAAQAIRPGKRNLLAAIFLGCVLRPIIVAEGSDPGALDLRREPEHDALIAGAAWSAIAAQTA
jgi:AcrR family transcriptional regulator